MKRLILFPLLIAARAWCAQGDITGASVETNGWVLKLFVEGLNTNGSINHGLATNNTLGTPKLTLSLRSMGFDTNGDPVVRQRTVYGTRHLRLPFPSQDTNDIATDGDNCVVRLALSDWIFSSDSNLTLNVLAGAYAVTNGIGTNCNAASDVSVTNNSTQVYPKCIANWTWPGMNRETNTNMRLRAAGFHGLSGGHGQPLACMKFIVQDENSNIVTNTITRMAIDRTLSDPIPTAEYFSDFTLSTFTNLDQLRCDFMAYPWIGDTNAIMDTRRDEMAYPLPAPITNLCDHQIAYTDLIAVVDSGGSDANGRPTNCAPTDVNSAHYFATINGAAAALKGTNNALFGHNDTGGVIIYVRDTIVNYPGGSTDVSAFAKAWATVMPYPGETVQLTSNTGGHTGRSLGGHTRLYQMNMEATSTAILFRYDNKLWFDQCHIDSDGLGPIWNTLNIFWTHCTVSNLDMSMKPYTDSHNTSQAIIRGNNFDGYDDDIAFNTMLANIFPNTNGGNARAIFDYAGSSVPSPNYSILYNNWIIGAIGAVEVVTQGSSVGTPGGSAVVQNIIEYAGINVNNNCLLVGTPDAYHYTNIIVWHNITVGKRSAYGYNDGGSDPSWKTAWSVKNNIFDISGFKTDTFTGEGGGDGGRVGNWSLMWGVGCSGNTHIHCTVDNGAASFKQHFWGMYSHNPPSTNATDWIRYVDRKATTGDGSYKNGAGDYRTKSDAPHILWQYEWVLPYDISGQSRTRLDPPGAYSSASPRRGSMFL